MGAGRKRKGEDLPQQGRGRGRQRETLGRLCFFRFESWFLHLRLERGRRRGALRLEGGGSEEDRGGGREARAPRPREEAPPIRLHAREQRVPRLRGGVKRERGKTPFLCSRSPARPPARSPVSACCCKSIDVALVPIVRFCPFFRGRKAELHVSFFEPRKQKITFLFISRFFWKKERTKK